MGHQALLWPTFSEPFLCARHWDKCFAYDPLALLPFTGNLLKEVVYTCVSIPVPSCSFEPSSNRPCPHLSAEIVLFKVTDDFYTAKSNDHFPILFLVDVSTGFDASIRLYHTFSCWVSFTKEKLDNTPPKLSISSYLTLRNKGWI